MKRIVVILFCLFICLSVFAQEKLDLYLLIGQSNMAGRGIYNLRSNLRILNEI